MKEEMKRILSQIEREIKRQKEEWGKNSPLDTATIEEIFQEYGIELQDFGEVGSCALVEKDEDGHYLWAGIYTGEGCIDDSGEYADAFIGFWWNNNEKDPSDGWIDHEGFWRKEGL